MPKKTPSRSASIDEINEVHRKLVKAVSTALDGELDTDGVHRLPTAAVLNVARQLVSDARIAPSSDVAEATQRLVHRLPFPNNDADDSLKTRAN